LRYAAGGMSGDELVDTVSFVRDRPTATAAAAARLIAVYPRELSWQVWLAERPIPIGRGPGEGGVQLPHQTVSRSHCTIAWDGAIGCHAVTDNGSHNGTSVDGEAIAAGTPRVLTPGAVVRFGDVFAVYEPMAGVGDDAPVVSTEQLPGASAAMRRARGQVARAAPDPSPVLVIGETGTGKEWVAREIHRLSGRRGPLVALNCAALAPQLVESQLFGHVRGAFTGATSDHVGMFRAADGGTLFLDEIGELPLELQPKLLRELQESRVIPVGATVPIPVDVRVVAATNRELSVEVDAGRFRRDLYARLALWEIAVPPLRDRRADILGWIDRLQAAWCDRRGVAAPPLVFKPEAAERLLLYRWLDNLRGIDRLVHALGGGAERMIELSELPGWLGAEPAAGSSAGMSAAANLAAAAAAVPAPPVVAAKGARRPAPSRDEVVAAYQETGGNVRAMARRFERDRRQIYRWLEAYGLRQPGDGSDDDTT